MSNADSVSLGPAVKADNRVTFMPVSNTFKLARVIALTSVVLLGRVTEQLQATRNNLRFDNKTVSRNHAQMWMENGKCFVQDTKSTGGTFLNGTRLSEQGKDSEPFEVTHGGVVALGQDVTNASGLVEHKRVEMSVLLNSQMKPEEQVHETDDDNVDYGSVSEVKFQVDTEFYNIWTTLTQGLEHPIKRLRDIISNLDSTAAPFVGINADVTVQKAINISGVLTSPGPGSAATMAPSPTTPTSSPAPPSLSSKPKVSISVALQSKLAVSPPAAPAVPTVNSTAPNVPAVTPAVPSAVPPAAPTAASTPPPPR